MKYLRTFVLILNAIASIALVLTYLSYYISSETFWILEGVALGYPVYVIVNICFAIFWLFTHHKKYAIISTAFILIGIRTLYSTVSISEKSPFENDSTSLKICTYNARAFTHQGWDKRMQTQAEIFEYFKKENPDVICVQEMHHDIKWPYVIYDSICDKLGLSYVKQYHHHYIPNRYFTGIVTFSKYPIVKAGYIDFQETGNASLWVDVAYLNDTIRIYNNHLESYRLVQNNIEVLEGTKNEHTFKTDEYTPIVSKFKNAVALRSKQTDELVDSIKHCKYPVFVCGDFNSPPYSYAYRNILSSQDLSDAFKGSGDFIGGTLNWDLTPLRLDYILYPEGWESASYKKGEIAVSDHFPISCKFRKEED